MSAEMIKKTFRGTVRSWQFHHLIVPDEYMERIKAELDIEHLLPIKVTGTVDSDPTGRFPVGTHVLTSLLTHYDEETGYCETLNSVYQLVGEGDNDVVSDLGNLVLLLDYS